MPDRLRFLLDAAGVLLFGLLRAEATVSDLDIFRQFVAAIESVPYHSKWTRANPNDALRWAGFRDAVLAGQTPTPPTMTTKYGAALADAGEMVLNADVTTPPVEPIPPAPEIPDELVDYDMVISVSGELQPVGAAWYGGAHIQYLT